MAEERYELDVKPDELLAEVRALRVVVEAMLLQLPDLAIEIAVESLKDHSKHAEHRLRETQSDRWRNYAAVAYEMAQRIEEDAGMHMAERATGARLTSIQEVPLSAEERRLRARFREED